MHINKVLNITILILIILLVVFIFFKNTSLFTNTILEDEKDNYEIYLFDDFENYEEYSEILDSSPEDLTRWKSGGVITAWVNIEDWSKIDKIDLKLTDSSGKELVLNGIENIKLPRSYNQIKSDDEFKDYSFNCDQKLTKWEDFMIVNGENFLFWEFDHSVSVDMSQIVSWEIYDGDSIFLAHDIVIHDGLCKEKNSLNGAWYSPNGLPQYGVWWTDEGKLVMKNVNQDQYPSNGDHTRILSLEDTPDDFFINAQFTVLIDDNSRWYNSLFGNFNEEYYKNSYIRFAWDFDDEYDPGHDQTLLYNSFEYGYLGLQRVYPIERYFVQGFEPHQTNNNAKTKFSFEDGHTYNVLIMVQGQFVEVEVYDIGNYYNRKVADINYEFEMERPNKSYPFSIEATGNVDIILDNIEVWKLKETNLLEVE